MRVSSFIGAGINLDIGGPSTKKLTEAVCNTTQYQSNGRNIKFINEIADQLDLYLKYDSNFEEIYHCLEYLISYSLAWEEPNKPWIRPYLGAFVEKRHGTNLFDRSLLFQSKQIFIETIADKLNSFCQNYRSSVNYSWYFNFWDQLNQACSLDIATLNYDTCVEECINNFEDGFEDTGYGYFRFNPKRIVNTDQSRFMHLHGSILYGYQNAGNPNQYVLEDHFEDLYKFNSYDIAKKTWSGRSEPICQSKETIGIGPIITGLRKTDKLIAYPYSTYYSLLDRLILDSPRLLIIGYSFGDLHFNNLLSRMARIHGCDRKMVIITCSPDQAQWCYDPTVMGWPSQKMYEFIARAFQEPQPLPRNYQNPIISHDGRARLYLRGFQDAVICHGQDIIDFLAN